MFLATLESNNYLPKVRYYFLLMNLLLCRFYDPGDTPTADRCLLLRLITYYLRDDRFVILWLLTYEVSVSVRIRQRVKQVIKQTTILKCNLTFCTISNKEIGYHFPYHVGKLSYNFIKMYWKWIFQGQNLILTFYWNYSEQIQWCWYQIRVL